MINSNARNLFDMLCATYAKIDDSDNHGSIVRILNHPDLYNLAHDRRYKIHPMAGTSYELCFEYRNMRYRVVAYKRDLLLYEDDLNCVIAYKRDLLYKDDLNSYSKGELLYKAHIPYREMR